MMTTDGGKRYALHTFHEFAITGAIQLLSAFIAFVAYQGYKRDGSQFIRFIALAYLGFTVVYAPHGILTPMAGSQPDSVCDFWSCFAFDYVCLFICRLVLSY